MRFKSSASCRVHQEASILYGFAVLLNVGGVTCMRDSIRGIFLQLTEVTFLPHPSSVILYTLPFFVLRNCVRRLFELEDIGPILGPNSFVSSLEIEI